MYTTDIKCNSKTLCIVEKKIMGPQSCFSQRGEKHNTGFWNLRQVNSNDLERVCGRGYIAVCRYKERKIMPAIK